MFFLMKICYFLSDLLAEASCFDVDKRPCWKSQILFCLILFIQMFLPNGKKAHFLHCTAFEVGPARISERAWLFSLVGHAAEAPLKLPEGCTRRLVGAAGCPIRQHCLLCSGGYHCATTQWHLKSSLFVYSRKWLNVIRQKTKLRRTNAQTCLCEILLLPKQCFTDVCLKMQLDMFLSRMFLWPLLNWCGCFDGIIPYFLWCQILYLKSNKTNFLFKYDCVKECRDISCALSFWFWFQRPKKYYSG